MPKGVEQKSDIQAILKNYKVSKIIFDWTIIIFAIASFGLFIAYIFSWHYAFLLGTALFAAFSVFIYINRRIYLKKIKKFTEDIAITKNNASAAKHNTNTPKETLMSLRRFASPDRAEQLLRILNDCRELVLNSKNPATVKGRISTGIRFGYSLRQLEEANIYKGTPTASEYLDFFYSAQQVLSGDDIDYEDPDYHASMTFFNKTHRLIGDLEMKYSFLYNAKEFHGEKMDECIALCYKLIDLAPQFKEFCNSEYIDPLPPYTPFWRLAIIYEKQGKFEDAAKICAQSIRLGFVRDKGKGMHVRLARLLRRAGITTSLDEFLKLPE